MTTIPFILQPATPAAIEQAAALLRAGALVAFPTETVYGLGADASNGIAVAKIFEAKGRPRFNPLIAHVTDQAAAEALGVFNGLANTLAQAFWPGPLTLVVRKQSGCPVCDLATAGLDTIAIRVPGDPVASALLRAAGIPIAAPSANRSGHVSPTTAQHVADDLGSRVALILDGGPAGVGLESTVVDASGDSPILLRSGAITRDDIARATGLDVLMASSDSDQTPTAPGQLRSHYAPNAVLRMNATHANPGEALLAFGAAGPADNGPVFNLSPTGDLREAASRLFAALRTLDSTGAAVIAVMPIPRTGLGEAINDRLTRAAAPRPR